MSGFPFLRKMAQLDEFTTDVTVSSFCTYFVCISEERWVLSTWTIYLLNLFSLSYSSILFLLGSFCLQNANIFMFQSHFLTWFTHGAFHLSFLWHWTWSGPVQWLFPVPLSLSILQIRSDQLLSRVQLFETPWIAARQASLSITNPRSSPRLMSIESAMPSSHLILCRPFSSCPQSLPASESFPMSQLFTWGGQSTGVSALASVLPKKSHPYPPAKANGLSVAFSCNGYTTSFLKSSTHLMSTTLPLPGSPSASIKAHSRTCSSVPLLLPASKCWHPSRSFIVLFVHYVI